MNDFDYFAIQKYYSSWRIQQSLTFTAHSDDDIEVTSAFKIARNSSNDFSSHHGLLKPSCLSTFGPPSGVPPPPGATPPYGSHAPLGPSLPLSHDQLGGFHPSMLLNAQLALQVQAAAMAAALQASTASPTSSIFSTPSRTTPPTSTSTHNGESGTLHSMEKMVAGINGNASE